MLNKEKIKDYVLLMLGAPVIKVELDEQQINFTIDLVCDLMEGMTVGWDDNYRYLVASEGSLSMAKIQLGRIRSKFNAADKGGDLDKSKAITASYPSFYLDGEILLKEGNEGFKLFTRRIFGDK